MVAMTMSFVGCDKNETIEPNIQQDVPLEEEPSRLKTGNVHANYYPNSAVSYALQYALAYNSSYQAQTNDCANFISQCLDAGALPQDNEWSYSKFLAGTDYTWVRAGELYDYLVSSNYDLSSRTHYYLYLRETRYLKPGDLVFYFNQYGNCKHVTIVTMIGSDAYISGHTDDRKNYPLRTSFNNWKTNGGISYIVTLHFN
jgi:hypothetical protein